MANNNIHELMKELEDFKNRFVKRKISVANELGCLDKSINSLLKKMELEDLSSEELLKISSEFQNLCRVRREIKSELKIFNDIDEDNKFTYNMLGYTLKEYKNKCKVIERLSQNPEKYNVNSDIKTIEVANKSDIEIEDLIERFKDKYDKVVYGTNTKKIYLYNNCRDM